MKKKSQKAPKTGGSHKAGGGSTTGGARGKKKVKDEVVFDASDLTQPLPVNLRVYALSLMTNRYHDAKILERRVKDEKFKINNVPWPPSPNPPLPHVEGVQPDFTNHTHIYYIHYTPWDRRMDEWVTRDRICLPHQLLLLQPPSYDIQMTASNAGSATTEQKEDDTMTSAAKGKSKEADDEDEEKDEDGEGKHAKKKGGDASKTVDPSKSGAGKAPKVPGVAGAEMLPGGDPHGGSLGGHGNFSEEDIKAHEEATKVKNIESIVFGKYHMSSWYFSPFPSEYNQYNILHFCEYCLNFFGVEEELRRHSRKCTLRHPPGNEIYRSEEKNVTVSVFEVDGAREKVYCQNLCLLSKLFLDHKTLEYDCTPFLFYIFCEIDADGYHIVGYFSKEKISLSKFNLACILTLPCHQRKGYGKLIISLSYELSKIEEKVGSPEKPISDLGKVSYMSYWSATLLKLLSQRPWGSDSISIEDLSRLTCITTDDIIECLKAMHVLVWYKGKWVFSDTALQQAIKEREEKKAELAKKEQDPNAIFVGQCKPEKLHWTPFFVNKKIAKQQGAL